jgi:hypothetical protein
MSRTSTSILPRYTYLPVTGDAPQAPPTEQSFWAALASGVGTQTLTWKVRDGNWSVVLMNADGSRGVSADIDLGAKLSFLLWVALGLLIGGALVTGGSAALVVLAARTPRTAACTAGACCRETRTWKYTGTRASRRIDRRAPVQLNALVQGHPRSRVTRGT